MNKGVMHLTQEQQDILDGKKGEVLAKVMKTLVMYGSLFGAESMEKVTGTYNHLVTSVGVTALKPVYDLIETLIDAGAVSSKKFTADPRPMDDNMPVRFCRTSYSKSLCSQDRKATKNSFRNWVFLRRMHSHAPATFQR